MSRRPKYLLKIAIEGPGVRPKSIAIPILVNICQNLQLAVNRQAESMRGGLSLRPGPKTQEIHRECTLELVGMGKGSTTLSFRLEKPQQPLPIPESTTFGADVVASVAKAIKTLENKKTADKSEIDAGVLDSFKSLGDVFEKKGITKVRLIVPKRNGQPRIDAAFTKPARDRVINKMKLPGEKEVTLEGTLEMGDFKESDRKCRIRPALGAPIVCTFDKEKENEVYEGLRKPIQLTGKARINPNTGKIEEVHITEIGIVDQLLVGAKEFFSGRSIEELAQAQGVSPLAKPEKLAGGWPEEEDLDEFLKDVYAGRSM